MINYVPLQVKSHYSLLRSTNRTDDLLSFAKEAKLPALAITDYGTISGCVNFFKTFKGSGVKPILGTTLYICPKDSKNKQEENSSFGYLTLLAMNLDGWKALIKITSYANHPDRFYNHPRLSLEELSSFSLQNLICITGGVGSVLANALFEDEKRAYGTNDKDMVAGLVSGNWRQKVDPVLSTLRGCFGDRLYLEGQLNDLTVRPVQGEIYKCLEKMELPILASSNAHYIQPEDCYDQRVLLCSHMKTTMIDVDKRVAGFDDGSYGSFFLSDRYCLNQHLPNKDRELRLTEEIAERCESYDITKKQTLPHFPCPDGLSEIEYLRQICRDNWKVKATRIPKEKYKEYGDRVNHELGLIEKMGYAGYFLIVKDILDHARTLGMVGPGRGSSSGSIVCYLTGITAVDSIKHNLLFLRFINPERVTLPDIDSDVPTCNRDKIIEYIKDRYGHDNVSQMITYGNLKGRSALTTVLSAYGGTNFTEIKKMTESVPDEAKISGDLQEMEENFGESSIIQWALENKKKELQEWCYLDDDGSLKGPYAKRFEQAIRLEDIKASQGKHAAGVVVSVAPLIESCPLVYDKHKDDLVGGFEMDDMESVGLVKLDILGNASFDKMMHCSSMLKTYTENIF